MSHESSTCIICGRQTSGLVVCYRCFFNYDHRLYDRKVPSSPVRLKHPATVPKLSSGSDIREVEYELTTPPPQKPVSSKKPPARFQLPPSPAITKVGGFWSRFGFS